MAQKILSSIIRFRIKRKTIEMIKLMIENIKRLYHEWRSREIEVYVDDVIKYLDRISTPDSNNN